jgi:hypothetical protein
MRFGNVIMTFPTALREARCTEPSNYAEPDEQKNDLKKKSTWEKEMALSTFLSSQAVS